METKLLQYLKKIDKKLNELTVLLREFESARDRMQSDEVEKMVSEKSKSFGTSNERSAYRQGRTDALLHSL